MTCAAAIGVIYWAEWIPSIGLPRRVLRHIRLHQWILPLCLAIDCARVITSTKYIAEGRAERCKVGFDLLNVPVFGAQWLLANQVTQGGLVAPSVRLVKDWLLITKQIPLPASSPQKETILSGTMVEEESEGKLASYAYLALSHRDPLQAKILKEVVGNSSWRLVYADYLTVVYARADGSYGGLPEFTMRPLYDQSMIGSALKSIQPLQGYREKLARWLWRREPPPAEAFYFGSFLLNAGKAREASDVLIFAALQSPNAPEVTRALGDASERLGEIEIAERAFGLYLMAESSDKEVRSHFEAAGNAVVKGLKVDEVLPDS